MIAVWKKCESFSAALAAPAKDGAFSAVRANAPWLEDEDASVLRRPRAALLEMLLLLALAGFFGVRAALGEGGRSDQAVAAAVPELLPAGQATSSSI